MPFALAIIAIVLVVVGARGVGNIRQLRDLLVGDFTGQHNFLAWIFAIGIIGVFGYIPGMEKISRAFLVLLFVVLILGTKGSFIAKIQDAFRNAGGTTTSPTISSAVTGTLNGLSGTNPATPTTGTPTP
jgi:small-conductance mechanosensitive channel